MTDFCVCLNVFSANGSFSLFFVLKKNFTDLRVLFHPTLCLTVGWGLDRLILGEAQIQKPLALSFEDACLYGDKPLKKGIERAQKEAIEFDTVIGKYKNEIIPFTPFSYNSSNSNLTTRIRNDVPFVDHISVSIRLTVKTGYLYL